MFSTFAWSTSLHRLLSSDSVLLVGYLFSNVRRIVKSCWSLSQEHISIMSSNLRVFFSKSVPCGKPPVQIKTSCHLLQEIWGEGNSPHITVQFQHPSTVKIWSVSVKSTAARRDCVQTCPMHRGSAAGSSALQPIPTHYWCVFEHLSTLVLWPLITKFLQHSVHVETFNWIPALTASTGSSGFPVPSISWNMCMFFCPCLDPQQRNQILHLLQCIQRLF